MFQFNRGISTDFVERLNTEYRKGGWWNAIANDQELFIAIRSGYINVYSKGSSLLKFWMEGNDLVGEIHYKYLLHPKSAQSYIKVINGQTKLDSAANLFIPDFTDLTNIKLAAKAYAGKEKTGVHQIVLANTNVIDVEIAFSTENEKIGKRTANRIDFAALRIEHTGPEIVFFEAKLFDNKELRANGENIPVLNQLHRYKIFIKNEKEALSNSYRTVCANLASLEGIRNRYTSILDTMKDIAENKYKLVIQDKIRLAIFGYDNAQKNDENWTTHRNKLAEDHDIKLLMNGDAKKFTNGISK